MRKLFILGNWKTYTLELSPKQWVEAGMKQKQAIQKAEEKGRVCVIIICPPCSKLKEVRDAINAADASDFLRLGVQDISAFPPGAHTGDEAAKQLRKDFGIEYAIIGHSERRREHEETETLLAQKITRALENTITPIFCVQNEHTIVPKGIDIVAYEPPHAISAVSGGIAENPLATQKVAAIMREKLASQHGGSTKGTYILYGGSVNAENIASFTNNNQLVHNFDGVLVGAKSVSPEFFTIVENA